MNQSESSYVVGQNDTLGTIAKKFGTSVLDLARLNKIADPDKISVGQRLAIPRNSERDAARSDGSGMPELHDWGVIQLRFVDAINRDIGQLKVTVDTGVCRPYDFVTDSSGLLPPFAVTAGDPVVKVSVERAAGGIKEVARIAPNNKSQLATLVSPKVATKAALRKHDGPSTPRQIPPGPKALGEEITTRSPDGHPVHEIALECPNPENLRLVANYQYRDIVIAAAKRGNLIPQAVAAIMNAEASTVPARYMTEPVLDLSTGQPKKGKDGKPAVRQRIDPTWRAGEWYAKSAAPSSSARGMTQFLDGTWIDLALTEGTHLNGRVKSEGWLTTTSVKLKRVKRVTEGKRVKKILEEYEKTVPAFKMSDDTFATAPSGLSLAVTLSRKPHVTASATASGNLQSLLDLRFDPECAIQAAVDYGLQNLGRLASAGYPVNTLSDAEKAKIVYLAHHLGFGDAVQFIENRITETKAQYLLEHQISVEDAKGRAKRHDEKYVPAHREWLDEYINKKIKLNQLYCDPSVAVEAKSLLSIVESLGEGKT
jgi:LysM repeat protein